MKKLVKQIIQGALILSSMALLTGCPSEGPKAKGKGAGDFGGGDALLLEVTPLQVKELVSKAKFVMVYSANHLDIILNGLEEDGSDIDAFKLGKSLKEILFGDPENNVYTMIEETEIVVELDKDCLDRSGKAVDGSVHNVKEGAFCISAKRLAGKLKANHAFGSVLGLLFHEIIHRLAGDGVEKEAKMVESLVYNTKENVTDLNWLDVIIRPLRESEVFIEQEIEKIDIILKTLEAKALVPGEPVTPEVFASICENKSSSIEKISSLTARMGSTDLGMSAYPFSVLGWYLGLSIQASIISSACRYEGAGTGFFNSNDPVSLLEYMTHPSNNSQSETVLKMIQDLSIKVIPLGRPDIHTIKRAYQNILKNLRVILSSTGRFVEVQYKEDRLGGADTAFEIMHNIQLTKRSEQGYSTPYYTQGKIADNNQQTFEYCQLAHSQYFPNDLIAEDRTKAVVPISAGPLKVSDPDDGYGTAFYHGEHNGKTVGVSVRCGKYNVEEGYSGIPVTTELMVRHLKGLLKKVVVQ